MGQVEPNIPKRQSNRSKYAEAEVEKESRGDVPEGRKVAFYVGMALLGLGFLMFFSVFFQGITGRFDTVQGPGSMAAAPIGMLLIGIGGGLMAVGRLGAAGSGLVLNPKKARTDLEPFSRQAGGMISDALSEMGLGNKKNEEVKEVVKIRCPHCQALNDESAKFCGQCGQLL